MLRALILLITNLTQLLWSMMRKFIRGLTAPFRKPKRRYVALNIPSGIELAAPPRKLGPLSLPSRGQGAWWEFDEVLTQIAEDPEIEGVFFRAEQTRMGLAEVSVIADRISALRDQGKRVICHMNQAMLADYLLATAADTIMMSPPGRLYTFGMRSEMMFLGEAFEKIGIRAQFVNLG
ncbi:MAG: S49 family peptidase, partial [Myxococcota bacterium]